MQQSKLLAEFLNRLISVETGPDCSCMFDGRTDI
jgi:hypothetical protein